MTHLGGLGVTRLSYTSVPTKPTHTHIQPNAHTHAYRTQTLSHTQSRAWFPEFNAAVTLPKATDAVARGKGFIRGFILWP